MVNNESKIIDSLSPPGYGLWCEEEVVIAGGHFPALIDIFVLQRVYVVFECAEEAVFKILNGAVAAQDILAVASVITAVQLFEFLVQTEHKVFGVIVRQVLEHRALVGHQKFVAAQPAVLISLSPELETVGHMFSAGKVIVFRHAARIEAKCFASGGAWASKIGGVDVVHFYEHPQRPRV